ncbi:MAG: porin family protein [Ferruginibacter sp.]
MLMTLSASAFAQYTPSFGLRAGLSSAGMRGESVDNLKNLLDFAKDKITTKNRTGFFAGGYASIPVSKKVFIEPGLYYTQKGYELVGAVAVKGVEFLNANAKAQLKSNYLDLPILLKAEIDGLSIFAGPQFSYLMNADLVTSGGVLGINLFNKTLDATSQFNRWDMGITAGVGYTFGNGVNISAAYDLGLQKVDANKNVSSYNNAIKIGLGIKF